MIELPANLARPFVPLADLDPDRPLPRARSHLLRLDRRRPKSPREPPLLLNSSVWKNHKTQPIQARRRQNDGVQTRVFVQPAQTGSHIAANRGEF